MSIIVSNVNVPALKESSLEEKGKELLNKEPPIVKDNTYNKNQKRNLFLKNIVASSAISSILGWRSRNDPSGQRFGIQDIVTNMGIMAGMVKNPNVTVNQLLETIKETTLFTLPTGIVLPDIASILGKNFGAMGTAVAATVPLALSEGAAIAINKASGAKPVEKLSEEELKQQKNEVLKTHIAVALASIYKAGLLYNNATKSTAAGSNNYVSNAMYTATLMNTLKASVITQFAHNRGEKVRASATASPVFFDGVISGSVVQVAENLSKKYMKNPNSLPNVLWQSALGGVVATGGIYAVQLGLDNALNWMLGIKPNDKETEKTIH